MSDNEPFEKREAAGAEDAATRARRLWKKRLPSSRRPPMDEGLCEALRGFVAEKKASEIGRAHV